MAAKGDGGEDMNMRKPRGPEPTRIHLTEKQRTILQEIVRCRHSPQYETIRARIILEADSGARNKHIADNFDVGRQMVCVWRTRWAKAAENLGQIESENDDKKLFNSIRTVLADDPRSGCPPKFTPEQICQIVALACSESPADSERPVSHWTRRELADEAIQREIVQNISPRTVGRFFLSRGSEAAQVQILAHQRKRKRS